MKKNARTLLATGLLAGAVTAYAVPAHAATTPFQITVEDREIAFDTQPFLQHEHLLVPLRAITENLGAQVTYDASTHIAMVTKGDVTLELDFQHHTTKKNGVQIAIDPAPQIVGDRAMVPLRFLSETFGNQVSYDANTRKVAVLATPDALAKREQIKGVLDKMTQAMADVKNLQEKIDVNLSLPDMHNERVPRSITVSALSDLVVQPITLHLTGQYSADSDHQSFEVYLADHKVYYRSTGHEGWMKQDGNVPEDATSSSYQDIAKQQYTVIQAMLPYLTMEETDKEYKIHLKADGAGLVKLIDEIQQVSGEPEMSTDEKAEVLYQFQHTKLDDLTLTIDKSSYYENSMIAHVEDNDPQMGISTLDLSDTLQNFNTTSVTIPEDVKTSAVDATGTW